MFQNAWFDKGTYKKVPKICEGQPSNFITTDKIEQIATTYWDEHCLECSAPACYSTCPKYVARKDFLCKRLIYGIKNGKPSKGLLWSATVKFREWGKLEARINKGTLSPKELLKLNSCDLWKTKVFKVGSFFLSNKDKKISSQWDGLKRKKYASIDRTTMFANDFLFQCYSYEKNTYCMNFEITDSNNSVIYKTGFQIKQGYNQELLKLDFLQPEGGLVRFYPENNIEAELTVFAADFVKIKGSIPEKANKKIKCIAWDLDKTVWDGILAESEPDKLQLRENVIETIQELDKRGIIQIIVSKNDVGAVEPLLEKLGIRKYFVYVLSNWNSKSVNIYNAARMLNINVDTFGLIDDSDFERREVSETLPCVRTYGENLSELLNNKEFNSEITSESIHRRESYIQEASRKQVLSNVFSGNNTDFIKNCKIEITVKSLKTKEEYARSFELLQRTNQLNLSGNKYSEEEFANILDDGKESVISFVKDKYGDYGQIAFIHYEFGENIVVSEFAMSCRVASKYVEAAIFNEMQKKYNKEIIMQGKKTERNGTLIEALNNCGFENSSKDDISICMNLNKDKTVPFAEINTINWIEGYEY